MLADKALERSVSKTTVLWAQELVALGYESINLYELAGESEPYDQIEIELLLDKVLKELGLVVTDKSSTISHYIYMLVKRNLHEPKVYSDVLNEIKEISLESNFPNLYYQMFYSLYYAKIELEYSDVQWYVRDANKGNIDSIILEYFQYFIYNY